MTTLFPAILFDGIVAELKQEEGFRSHAYQDSLGNWSVAFGRCIQKSIGLGISESEAVVLLENDVLRSIEEVRRAFSWFDTLSATRQSVLVQLCFQLGLPKLNSFKRMLAALGSENPDYDLAAVELLDSRYARQVPMRAERLADKLRD